MNVSTYGDVVRGIKQQLALGVILQNGLILEEEVFEVQGFNELGFVLRKKNTNE